MANKRCSETGGSVVVTIDAAVAAVAELGLGRV
jgi:hypothetical protein